MTCQICEIKLTKKAAATGCCGMILCKQCINNSKHYCNANDEYPQSVANDPIVSDSFVAQNSHTSVDNVLKAANQMIQHSKKLPTTQQKIDLLHRGLDISVGCPDVHAIILKEYNKLVKSPAEPVG
jgi:hypothetical protein